MPSTIELALVVLGAILILQFQYWAANSRFLEQILKVQQVGLDVL